MRREPVGWRRRRLDEYDPFRVEGLEGSNTGVWVRRRGTMCDRRESGERDNV